MALAKSFRDYPIAEFRALQIWQILVCAAVNRRTLTYALLAHEMGYKKAAGVLANSLGHVAYYCELSKLPPLTAIVVNEKTGLPGDGIPVDQSLQKRERVFRYKWFDVIPPNPADLKSAADRGRARH